MPATEVEVINEVLGNGFHSQGWYVSVLTSQRNWRVCASFVGVLADCSDVVSGFFQVIHL